MIGELQKLKEMAAYCQSRDTEGLPSEMIVSFIKHDTRLAQAIEQAYAMHLVLSQEFEALLTQAESEQIKALQSDYVNFYAQDAINPYIPLAAKGPWIVTSCGGVIYDSGGYGMLGFGHNPDKVLEAISRPQVMANIMTANFSQKRFVEALKQEIGHTRSKASRHPYGRFLCLNSGSEANTLAMRFSDQHALAHLRAEGGLGSRKIKILALKGSFHGRTERPAQASDSSLNTYRKHLASFQGLDQLITIPPNDLKALELAFKRAEAEGFYIEAFLIEPVMGEGDPGKAITAAFYQRARQLTAEHGSLLVVDSIQAGLRAYGCLSLMDYPGFQNFDPPDMESFSKALNAGQYPLSVLAISETLAKQYVTGLYGNTMTANPRALDVATAVLKEIKPELRSNIKERGVEFLEKLNRLQKEFPHLITSVQGTGLLFSLGLNPEKVKVVGGNGIEAQLRKHGLGVIHGGENALRFTPCFTVTSQEIDLVLSLLHTALSQITSAHVVNS